MSADPTDPNEIPAGAFSEWLRGMQRALRGDQDSDVPCGDCRACCRSSQFIHIEPDETDTLAHIPRALRFPAPGLPAGNVLLGYDEQGECPMLTEKGCSIYEHRPRACRMYDCRIFAATGIPIDDPAKAPVARQVRRWRFALATSHDRVARDAVRTAAARLTDSASQLPPGTVRPSPVELAVRSIRAVSI